MSVSKQFGTNLARCGQATGLSQEEAAFRTSVHRTEISQLERGLRLARIDTVVKLAGALEISADETSRRAGVEAGSEDFRKFPFRWEGEA